MTRSNFNIGCLSVTAVILLTGIVVLGTLQTRQVYASGMIDSSGNYTLLTGQLNDTNELVYLLDSASNRLGVYRMNESTKQLEVLQVIPLSDQQTGQKDQKPRLRP